MDKDELDLPEPEPGERRLNIQMPTELIGGVYSNFANVSFSQYEFTLTFARIEHETEEGDVPGAVVARVNASPRFVPELTRDDVLPDVALVRHPQDRPVGALARQSQHHRAERRQKHRRRGDVGDVERVVHAERIILDVDSAGDDILAVLFAAAAPQLKLEGVTTVADVWPALDLGEEPAGLLYAVNRAYVDRAQELHDGDEVAVIPPVSGGDFRISSEPLDVAAAIAEAESDDAGAIATFVGTVRRRSRDRNVLYLEYEAFEEMAEPMLRRLAGELTEKHGLCEVAIHHRVGAVDIGEPSVVIAVSFWRSRAGACCRAFTDSWPAPGRSGSWRRSGL